MFLALLFPLLSSAFPFSSHTSLLDVLPGSIDLPAHRLETLNLLRQFSPQPAQFQPPDSHYLLGNSHASLDHVVEVAEKRQNQIPDYGAPYPPTWLDIYNISSLSLLSRAAVTRMSTWLQTDYQYEWTPWWEHPVLGIAYADLDIALGDGFNKDIITTLLENNDFGTSYIIDKYIDDQAWWGLFALRGYLLYGNEKWLQAAATIEQNSTAYWDNTCGGGVLWLTYVPGVKNTITNALYFSLLTRLYLLTGLPYYYEQSVIVLEWWLSWSFSPSTAEVYDDMSASPACKPQGKQSWTYNSATMIPGLVDLYRSTGNETLLDLARSMAYGGMRDFSTFGEGILRERCENDVPDDDEGGVAPGCGQDAIVFKGIFVSGLKDLYLARQDENILNYLNTQLLSATFNNMDNTWLYGQWWSGPWNETTAGPKTQICALSLLSAAVGVNVDFVRHYEANGYSAPTR